MGSLCAGGEPALAIAAGSWGSRRLSTGYTLEDAWHDDRLSAIVVMLNPVLYSYVYKSGGARGSALAAAMTTRLFSDLIECGAEAVIP